MLAVQRRGHAQLDIAHPAPAQLEQAALPIRVKPQRPLTDVAIILAGGLNEGPLRRVGVPTGVTLAAPMREPILVLKALVKVVAVFNLTAAATLFVEHLLLPRAQRPGTYEVPHGPLFLRG